MLTIVPFGGLRQTREKNIKKGMMPKDDMSDSEVHEQHL